MRFYDCGPKEAPVMLLFHATNTRWDLFSRSAELLSEKYRVILPILPGYDPETPGDFTAVEEIAGETAAYIRQQGIPELELLYGVSMGGSCALCLLIREGIVARHTVLDAAMTPSGIPRFLGRATAYRDFSYSRGIRNRKMLNVAYPAKKYDPERVDYLHRVGVETSDKTMLESLYSCKNYSLPKTFPEIHTEMYFWYGSKEKAMLYKNLRFMEKHFPQTRYVERPGMNHAEFCTFHQEELARDLMEIVR